MHKLFITLTAILAPLSAVHAQSAPGQVERYTYTYVTPGAATDFTGASYVYNNAINFDATAGTINTTLNIQPGAQNIAIYGQGTTTVSPLSVPDFTLATPLTITSPGGSGQGLGFDYTGGASGFLAPTIIGSRYALSFAGGGTNFVDTGGRFYSSVIILGDWSSATTRTAATFSGGYSIIDNFVFDGTNTRFTVETVNYTLGNNPGISFALLGAVVAVPEPATWTMLIVGFGIVGFGLRRQRGRAFSRSLSLG